MEKREISKTDLLRRSALVMRSWEETFFGGSFPWVYFDYTPSTYTHGVTH
jgi:hypothetical protein